MNRGGVSTDRAQRIRTAPEPPAGTLLLANLRRTSALGFVLPVLATTLCLLLAFHTTEAAVQRVDVATLHGMVRARVAPLTWLALALNVVGSTYVTVPVRAAVVVFLTARRRWWFLTTFVLANVLEEVALHFLKSAYDRARPPDPLVHTSGASFPSGHAGVTAVIAVSLVICLFRPGRSRRRWELAAIALTLVMGASRAYLAAHWLSDAVGGVLIGSSIALGTAVVVQTVHDWLRRRAERGFEPPSRVEEAVEVAAEEEPGPLEASAVDHDGRAADQPADRPGPGG